MKEIETDRCILRKVNIKDEKNIYDILSDEDVIKFQEHCKDIENIIESLKDNYYFRKKL